MVSILASLEFSTNLYSLLGKFCLVTLSSLKGIQTKMLAELWGSIKSCKAAKLRGADMAFHLAY